ncbi:MAG: hypothetical protein N3G75_09265 [Methanothrix sp.]|nr:hypothetical protein [Methanothrix sp.]MCX8207996.1 hypothetical protein [Methanothrix sp.]
MRRSRPVLLSTEDYERLLKLDDRIESIQIAYEQNMLAVIEFERQLRQLSEAVRQLTTSTRQLLVLMQSTRDELKRIGGGYDEI